MTKKDDPTVVALYRQHIEHVGRERGYKAVPGPCCGKFLWTKAEVVLDPRTLEGDILTRVANQHRKRYPTHADLPDDVSVEYRRRVRELGRERGYDTVQCPECSKPLWTTGEIVPARL